jgi:hypothetical protein
VCVCIKCALLVILSDSIGVRVNYVLLKTGGFTFTCPRKVMEDGKGKVLKFRTEEYSQFRIIQKL